MLYEAPVLFIMSASLSLFGHETVRESLRANTLNWLVEEKQPTIKYPAGVCDQIVEEEETGR
jgi:hypothetical protein